MNIFDEAKPRSGSSEAKKRQRTVSKAVRKLLDAKDEKTLIEGLGKDFGITPASGLRENHFCLEE
jgi:hypothetical protein